MINEFSISRDRVMINFTSKYCDSAESLLESNGFRRVLETFLVKLKKNQNLIYTYYLDEFKTEEEFIKSLTEAFKLLIMFDIEDIVKVDNKYSIFFEKRAMFIELIELIYSYWRRLERFTIIRNNRFGDGIQNVRFIEANNKFTELILKVYRKIEETVMGYNHRVYRQLVAGANAGISLSDVVWEMPIEYKGLESLPFIRNVVLNPPFISYSERNTRKGLFEESKTNPLKDKILNEDDYFIYPAKIGDLLAFVIFHRDFMIHGIALSNLFELAKEEEYMNKKPDMIYLFGYPDGNDEKKTYYYKDRKNDIFIGYANYSDDVDYFGYMKKMLLTLHNVKKIEDGELPIHGAMVNVVLKNGIEKNIVIMGDSGAGKSESLEAFRNLNEKYIKYMRIIFDDMGFLKEEDGVIKGYGTEVGAFVRVDDLDTGYAFEQLDRGIFINPNKINARVIIPVATYETISNGYPIDIFLYANNYDEQEEKLTFFDNKEEAIKIFKDGARVAKGTTSEEGLVKSYFANPFGPLQEKEKTDILIENYFEKLFKQNVKIGEIKTNLAVKGKEQMGPREAAEKLFELINE